MPYDIYLVFGLAILVLTIPSIVSAVVEGYAPRFSAIMILIGGGLLVLAVTQKPGGYTFQDVPFAITRVVAHFLH